MPAKEVFHFVSEQGSSDSAFLSEIAASNDLAYQQRVVAESANMRRIPHGFFRLRIAMIVNRKITLSA